MKKQCTQGLSASITIFLALSLTLIISVILTTIENSRKLALTAYLEGVSAIALDSAFSDYCSQLWEQYHIFAVISNLDDMDSHISSYVMSNLSLNTNISNNGASFLSCRLNDVSINELSNITDDYGEIFIHQILSYMQYMEISNIAEYLFIDSNIDYDPSGLASLAEGEMTAESLDALDFGSLIDMVETANSTLADDDNHNSQPNANLPETFTLDSLQRISHIFNEMLLHYIVDSPSDISYKSFDQNGFPSTYLDMDENSYSSFEPLESFLFCEYTRSCFSSYTTTVNESALDYQLEYLLHGYKSDENNLLATAKELVLLRLGFNVAHILTNQDKINTISSIANTCLIIPALPIIIETLLIVLWALSESVIDVRNLLSGKNVPLIKSADDWNLPINALLDFDYESPSVSNNSDGLSYDQYLEMLLFSRKLNTLAVRTMDLIQLDFSTNINDTFTIQSCYVGASCTFRYYSPDIFSSVRFHGRRNILTIYHFTQNYYYR